ncbi:DNA topoisomerase 2 [Artemisia annua]|uniref:DNA topoisomerase (ATP-hydrolyzing) n=1 Tax=Artemisia annua TaxID=35608 RepID=A0A2U1NH24_ARTAN|nr:DNA topoisomerase 2 [Artemisia annua]
MQFADLFVGKLDISNLEDATFFRILHVNSDRRIFSQTFYCKSHISGYMICLDINMVHVYPLEGKFLNVRDASPQQLLENDEIQNIKNILGLQFGKTYENVKELRYGHLMIMANQGYDSLHIIGLLINFLHYFWPSLLKVKSFMSVFITPVIKAASENTNEVSLFYTMPEYHKWQKNLGNKVTEYKMKYLELEGLESEERAEYLDQHVKEFVWIDDLDGREIEIAFS